MVSHRPARTAYIGPTPDPQLYLRSRIRSYDLERSWTDHEHRVTHCRRPQVRRPSFHHVILPRAECRLASVLQT